MKTKMGETMILYGLKTCDTCRKARKALPDASFVDVRESGVPRDILDAAHERFGGKLLNVRSTTWRNLSDSEREGDPLELIEAHPTLMKRPLIVAENGMWLGWDKSVQSELSDA